MRDRDDDGFGEFYERLQPRAVAAARKLVGDHALAEDVAAEAFSRALSHWKKVRSHPNPDAWLLRVVGNLAIDNVRRAGRAIDLRDTGGRPDSAGDDAVLRTDLAAALRKLSTRQREVVVMRYLVDLTEEDVAVSLGMSTGSVKTHLHRATTRLRDDLGDPHALQGTTPAGTSGAEAGHGVGGSARG